jgi:hypothetical protein
MTSEGMYSFVVVGTPNQLHKKRTKQHLNASKKSTSTKEREAPKKRKIHWEGVIKPNQ